MGQRVHVDARDVFELAGQFGVGRAFETAQAMKLKPMTFQILGIELTQTPVR